MRALAAILLVACGGKTVVVAPPPLDHHEAPPKPVEWDKLVGPIRSVEVNGADQTLVVKARTALAGEIGTPLDRARLRGQLAMLFEQGASEVTTHGAQLADGVQLVVEIAPEPTLHALTARDAAGAAIALPSQFVAAIGLPVDPVLLAGTAQSLRDSYLDRGYLDATADWKATPVGTGKVDVVIEVVPGKAVTIDRLEFPGATHVKHDELAKAIGTELAPGQPWKKDIIERATLLLQVVYYDRGYVNITIDTPQPQGEKSPVTFTVHEGAQFHLRKLAIKGVPAQQIKKYEKLIQMKTGAVFNRSLVVAAIKRIQDAAMADGSPNATVTPSTEIDAETHVIDITFEISKP